MNTPAAPSIVRTLVPVAVGQIVSYFTTIGLTVPEEVQAALTVILGFVVATLYYLAVRFLEQRFPKLGALLGWAATPDGYTPAKERELEKLAAAEVDDTPVPDDYRPKH
ncbi:hypothetical protein [Brevibacterium linens]|uniref:hypothetical protein n=1 Tax=Brevibacterium linens TaxID=1703 RepID=UPI003BF5F2EB